MGLGNLYGCLMLQDWGVRMYQGVGLNGIGVSGLAINTVYEPIKYFSANVGFCRILSEFMS